MLNTTGERATRPAFARRNLLKATQQAKKRVGEGDCVEAFARRNLLEVMQQAKKRVGEGDCVEAFARRNLLKVMQQAKKRVGEGDCVEAFARKDLLKQRCELENVWAKKIKIWCSPTYALRGMHREKDGREKGYPKARRQEHSPTPRRITTTIAWGSILGSTSARTN